MKKQALISKIHDVDAKIQSTRKVTRKAMDKLDRDGAELQTRGFRELSGVGIENSDWPFTLVQADSELWQNAWALTSRCRDLMRSNSLYIKYRNSLMANIFGDKGIVLRMKIKETEDRVVNSPAEKWALVAHENRIKRLLDYASSKQGTPLQVYRAYHLAEALERSRPEDILTQRAMIKVGAPDVFANMLIERRWDEWQRCEFCDIRKTRDYNTLRQLRLIQAVTDGDCFIRFIRSPGRNKFGFSLQVINAEWCDRFYNTLLPNGNVVIMGIEYEMTVWGVGAPVAYYFIKRQPQDWQFTIPGAFNFSGGHLHVRIDAEEIIHYARPVDADATRPAPWIATTIPKGRQLDQAELYEVIAMREEATKVGFLQSTINAAGGQDVATPDPRTGIPKWKVGAGDIIPLPWGVEYKERDPKHPTANIPGFSKEMIRRISAGMPGADYNVIANDLENINFSAGRLGRLDTNEQCKMIQAFDIDRAERPIFEAWLEMSLMTGAIELPLPKFAKFNKPVFTGRRWAQVDEVKAETAAAMRIQNNVSNWAIECDEGGVDFETVIAEKAENLMVMEQYGIDPTLTVSEPPKQTAIGEDDEDTEPEQPPVANGSAKKPKSKNRLALL